MTSPAIVGLTYDGNDIQQSDLTIFFEIVRGLNELPDTRGTDTVVPSLAGRIERGRINDVIQIELRGWVTSDPTETVLAAMRSSFRSNMQAVRALFASNRSRAQLAATLEDASVVSISARPMNLVVAREIASEYASVSIELEAYDDWTTGPLLVTPLTRALVLTRYAPTAGHNHKLATPSTTALVTTKYPPTVT